MLPLNLINDTPEEELLTVLDVAKKLGVSDTTVFALIDDGLLGYCDLTKEGRVRRNLRVPVSAYNAFVKARTTDARISA